MKEANMPLPCELHSFHTPNWLFFPVKSLTNKCNRIFYLFNYFSEDPDIMESISITSSIIGIVAAAAKVVQLLRQIGQAVEFAQPAARALISEVHNSTLVLTALQIIFEDPDAIPFRRRDLIHLDQLITTFTNGVLVFSELEAFLLGLGAAEGVMPLRKTWKRKEEEVTLLSLRIQNFRSSISVILSILQWYVKGCCLYTIFPPSLGACPQSPKAVNSLNRDTDLL
jgi:hypothetical protein